MTCPRSKSLAALLQRFDASTLKLEGCVEAHIPSPSGTKNDRTDISSSASMNRRRGAVLQPRLDWFEAGSDHEEQIGFQRRARAHINMGKLDGCLRAPTIRVV